MRLKNKLKLKILANVCITAFIYNNFFKNVFAFFKLFTDIRHEKSLTFFSLFSINTSIKNYLSSQNSLKFNNPLKSYFYSCIKILKILGNKFYFLYIINIKFFVRKKIKK